MWMSPDACALAQLTKPGCDNHLAGASCCAYEKESSGHSLSLDIFKMASNVDDPILVQHLCHVTHCFSMLCYVMLWYVVLWYVL